MHGRDRVRLVEQWQALAEWFDTQPGSLLLEQEREELERHLPYLFGYHLLHLGPVGGPALLDSSKVAQRSRIGWRVDDRDSAVVADADALPIASESVDVVILHHLLEFHPQPHQVLREVDRVLIGDGHLIVVTFNPFSTWGIWRSALAWRDRPPWSGRFYSAARIGEWCQLLGFEISHRRWLYYRPPLRRALFNRRLEFLERLGAYVSPRMAAAHVLVAQKRSVPISLTLVPKRRAFIGAVAESGIRGVSRLP